MSVTITVSDSGKYATVSGPLHTCEIHGIEDARRWVRFYESESRRRFGHFYKPKLAAFQEVLSQMEAKQGACNGR